MAANGKLTNTKTPGVYKRPEGSYAVVHRVDGKQCWGRRVATTKLGG